MVLPFRLKSTRQAGVWRMRDCTQLPRIIPYRGRAAKPLVEPLSPMLSYLRYHCYV